MMETAELQPIEAVSRTPVESSRDDAFHSLWLQSGSPAGGRLREVELEQISLI